MRITDIERILGARAQRQPVALVRDLENGTQVIVAEKGDDSATGLTQEVLASIRASLAEDRSGEIETEIGRLFVQCFVPAPRLLIVGAVHITQALAPMAEILGYRVSVVDPRRAFASQERFPGAELSHDWPDEAMARLAPDRRSAVVTLTHDPKLDDPALIAALRSEAFYVGALGSRKTHAARLERLGRAGFTETDLARIHGPAGIDVGARSPAEIALSVLAEMTVKRHGKRRP